MSDRRGALIMIYVVAIAVGIAAGIAIFGSVAR